jgi:ketosteroid isomerase-like protein
MSEANAKTVHELYEAFGRGDVPFIIGALDLEVEWWEAESFIYADGNPYVGPNSVLHGVFGRINDEWEWFKVLPNEVLDAGDTIVSHGYYNGVFKRSGREARAQFAHFFTFRDGKITKFQQYTDTAQFLAATAA